MDNKQSKIEFYTDGATKEVVGSETFIKEMLDKFPPKKPSVTSEEKKDSPILRATDKIYNAFTECKGLISILVIIIFIVLIVKPNIEFLKVVLDYKVEAETLRVFFGTIIGSIVTAIAVLSAIVVALTSSSGKEEAKRILWQRYLARYLKYNTIVIALNLIFLISTEAISKFDRGLAFLFLSSVLIIYSVFLVIKVAEKSFDELHGNNL